jgi:tRNA U34 2-thiouridine synthase MnmA/TrmU
LPGRAQCLERADRHALISRLELKEVNWILPGNYDVLSVKTTASSNLVAATVENISSYSCSIVFVNPQPATCIEPTCAFYIGSVLVGGGIIKNVFYV